MLRGEGECECESECECECDNAGRSLIGQQNRIYTGNSESHCALSGFSGLEVVCWLLAPKFAGSHPAEAVGFLGRKYPQHAFLRRGSKAFGPML